jgi:hypothetical protein
MYIDYRKTIEQHKAVLAELIYRNTTVDDEDECWIHFAWLAHVRIRPTVRQRIVPLFYKY